MYSHYIKAALDNNEIVIVLPFYETVDSVRQVLSEDSACIDVRKKEKESKIAAQLFADAMITTLVVQSAILTQMAMCSVGILEEVIQKFAKRTWRR
jgi:hypothetical protein